MCNNILTFENIQINQENIKNKTAVINFAFLMLILFSISLQGQENNDWYVYSE